MQNLPTLQVIIADNNLINTVRIPQTYFKQKKTVDNSNQNSNQNFLSELNSKSQSHPETKLPIRRISRSNSGISHGSSSSNGTNGTSNDRKVGGKEGRDNENKDSSITTLGLLALTDVYLSNNLISSFDGLYTLGTNIEVFDLKCNNIDISLNEFKEDIFVVFSTLKNLTDLKISTTSSSTTPTFTRTPTTINNATTNTASIHNNGNGTKNTTATNTTTGDMHHTASTDTTNCSRDFYTNIFSTCASLKTFNGRNSMGKLELTIKSNIFVALGSVYMCNAWCNSCFVLFYCISVY